MTTMVVPPLDIKMMRGRTVWASTATDKFAAWGRHRSFVVVVHGVGNIELVVQHTGTACIFRTVASRRGGTAERWAKKMGTACKFRTVARHWCGTIEGPWSDNRRFAMRTARASTATDTQYVG